MKPNLTIIAWVVIAVLATLFITSKTSKSPETWKAEIAGKDSAIAFTQRDRDRERGENEAKDRELEIKDSLLKIKSTTIEYRIKTIPVTVRSLPDDELKRAIEGLTDGQ